ncbi:conserved exported hypothetical protein [Candidatus Sulfopaludibacter sp. SbA3]|nr:conserved exported hypothetical protein [Candidatus Sulfopaludibacter sp. SbA3]
MPRSGLLSFLAVALLHAQTFDAASVKIHQAGDAEEPRNGPWLQVTPGAVTMRNAELLWCLGWAYGQRAAWISGPDWITSERYDIIAKAAGPVPPARLEVMMRTLLTERFKLAFHRESRELPVLALVLARNGPKNLTAAAAGGPPDGPRPIGGKQPQGLIFKNVAMSDFAERLGGPPPLGVAETVIDGTGLTGSFDITLKLDTEHFAGGREDFPDLLKSALEGQFGLKLERRKMPLDFLIVDRGNRIPVEN